MDSETVKSYFQNPRVVADYARAAEDVRQYGKAKRYQDDMQSLYGKDPY